MYTDEQNKKINKMDSIMKLIWGGTFLMYLFYWNIINSNNFELIYNKELLREPTIFTYLILSFTTLLLSLILSNKLFSDAHLTNNKFFNFLAGGHSSTDNSVTNSETNITTNLSFILKLFVIAVGLAHISTALGMISSLLLENSLPFYFLTTLSLTCMILIRPKLKKLINLSNLNI